MSKKQLQSLLSFVGLIVALAAYLLKQPDLKALTDPSLTPTSTPVLVEATSTAPAAPAPVVQTSSTNALVTHVADGDTIEALLDGSKDAVKIRLLGVNTPETVDPRRPVECFGKEASAFTKSLLSNQRILLVEDPAADNVDKYGRLLRNVVLADGTDFNAKLIQEGYAYAYLSFPLNKQRKVDLKRFETEAKTAGKGLWNVETCKGVK